MTEFRWNKFSLYCGIRYDLYTDDYKVVIGTEKNNSMFFIVETLKSNSWKDIGQVNYMANSGYLFNRFGILFNGALHWFMNNLDTDKKVILCFDLKEEEFKEVLQPHNTIYMYLIAITNSRLW